MYAIGNIILGTHLPWSKEDARKVAKALVAANPSWWREGEETDEDLIAAAEQDEVPVFDHAPWCTEYHGGADAPVAWVGVRLDVFDETDHLPLARLKEIVPTDEQMRGARDAYEQLPATVREMLPPFDIYIVWGSS